MGKHTVPADEAQDAVRGASRATRTRVVTAIALVALGASSCSLFKGSSTTASPTPSQAAPTDTSPASLPPTPAVTTSVSPTPTPTHAVSPSPTPKKSATPTPSSTARVVTPTVSPTPEITGATGSTVAVKVGAQASLKLLADTGTAWSITTQPAAGILSIVSTQAVTRTTNPGAGQVEYHWTFQGVAAGTTTFTVTEVPAAAGGTAPNNVTYTLHFTVS